jgi:hypothetical protein
VTVVGARCSSGGDDVAEDDGADRLIADRLSALIDEHRGTSADEDDGDDGAAGSLVPVP